MNRSGASPAPLRSLSGCIAAVPGNRLESKAPETRLVHESETAQAVRGVADRVSRRHVFGTGVATAGPERADGKLERKTGRVGHGQFRSRPSRIGVPTAA